jgi:hypothetical protein
MVGREPLWIHEVTDALALQSGAPVIPSIQVGSDESLPIDAFRSSIIEALKAPSQGVIFWHWRGLETDPERFEAARGVLRGQ